MDLQTVLAQALIFVVGAICMYAYFSNKRDQEYNREFARVNKEVIELVLVVLTKNFQTREELWQKAIEADTGGVLLNVYETQFREVLDFLRDCKDYKVDKQYVDLSKGTREFSTRRVNFTFEYRMEK